MIDIDSQEIKPADDETYVDMNDLADELPESSPRFILLSYPLTVVCSFKKLTDLVAHKCYGRVACRFLMFSSTISPRIVIPRPECRTQAQLS